MVTTNYPAKVGVLCAGDDFDSLHALLDQDLLPYVVALEYAHSLGLQFYVQFRMGLGEVETDRNFDSAPSSPDGQGVRG